MKIAIAQLNYHIGNFKDNVEKVRTTIAKVKDANADIVVFSELSICGYPPRDFLEFEDFISLCDESIHTIAKECKDIAVIIGAPSKNPNPNGKGLFNSAYLLSDGVVKSVHHKALLPNYDIFDEYRYFEPADSFSIAEYKGHKLAITICEDIWNLSENQMYRTNPMGKLMEQNPDIIINISASPFDYAHIEERKETCIENAKKYNLPLFFVNHIGAQTELIFDGGSMVVNQEGTIIDTAYHFEEDIRLYELNEKSGSLQFIHSFREPTTALSPSPSKTELIQNALILGIKDYFIKSNLKKAIVGLSGGIDSAVTLVLAAKALGKDNIRAILMPSKFSSDHSVNDAKKLAENIGCPYDIIGIDSITDSFESTLKPHFDNKPFDIAEENIQARARGVILMGLANKFGYVLFNTSNKSETAVGYGTLYGDMAGGISVLGDVYKMEVYELANYINSKEEIIPQHIVDKPPSAELRPNQKDSDSLPDYTILDQILYQYIELRKGPKEIINEGFDEELVTRILKMVNQNEYKRFQTPPILRVSPKAFGMGRRIPIVGKYLT